MNKKKRIVEKIIFFIGFVLCVYPLVSGAIERIHQQGAIATYNESMENQTEEKLKEALKDAEAYNDMLWQTGGGIVGNIQEAILDEKEYGKQLNVSGNGMMGSLTIPKINVNLPIYHGTDEETLKNGAGHVRESSLPAGGLNTHSLLSGHRGLPTSKLFTRLDELEKGDLFFIDVCGQKLAYQIQEIRVIRPEEIEGLGIRPNQDLVSLITCTPYGLNTHRLVVTGERVPYVENKEKKIRGKIMSFRERIFTALPFVFIAICIGIKLKDECDVRKRKVV